MRQISRQPKVSVVIPCYNAGLTIVATLESVLRQTEWDYEIIVVDDGSRDSSPWLVRAMSQQDGRIRLLEQSNGGVSAARNAGIGAARARFVALLDADDLWRPDHIECHLRRFEREPRLGVSFSAARFVDASGRAVGQSRSKLTDLKPVDLLMGNPTTTCSTLVIRREVFSEVGMFRTTMRHNEDQEWLFRVSLSGWLIAGDSEPRVDYRTSPGGLAADLQGMLRGFEIMIVEARKAAPVLVKRNESAARAATLRYLARRAIRLGLERSVARAYILAALRADRRLLLREPVATMATFVAAFVPQLSYRSSVATRPLAARA
jgi:cellulose synthase/poly-beta-1,6-N-acetylglucosamine synthase-like glycosyltransferase